jgi:recombination protein RecA
VQRRSLSEPDRDCLGLIISQWREKVGVLWGDNKTTPYGRGKEFHYMVRVETRRDDWVTRGDRKVGITLKARTVKNKTAPPQRVAQVDFYWEDVLSPEGLVQFHAGDYDTVKEVSNIAMALDVVTRRGAFYYYGEQSWQGKEGFLEQLREEPALLDEIKALVLHQTTGAPLPPTVSQPKTTRRRLVKA